MLGCIIDIMLIGVILHLVNDEEFDLLRVLMVAVGASVLTFAAVLGLSFILPELLASLAALVVSALAVGVLVSAVFGVEIKRSLMIGGIYVACSFAIRLCFMLFAMMMGAGDG